MKFMRSLVALSTIAAASMFAACGDDSSSANGSSECEVTNGVVVVKPASGDKFKMGETITVVYGSDLAKGGFIFEFRTDADEKGKSYSKESMGEEKPDGKTCYEQKLELKEGFAAPSDKAVIRVIPYYETAKGKNSAEFTVTE